MTRLAPAPLAPQLLAARRPPRPPKRLPRSMVPLVPLSPRQLIARGVSRLLTVLLLGFVVNLTVLSHVQHFAAQQQAGNVFRAELAAGTAPVSEADFNGVVLDDGAPVALLDIPSIGVHEIVVEGTGAGELMIGPGHRRDSVLPGQQGISVIMGRSAAYGGPFSQLQQLAPGETFTVRTGQGEQTFSVIGVRYAGDPAPPSPVAGEGRLILETARGPAYMPGGVVRVDAQLMGDADPAGARITSFVALAPEQKELATDTTSAWTLVVALQLLVVAELAAVWTFRRLGPMKTWVVFAPVLLLAGTLVSDQLIRLLPNLL